MVIAAARAATPSPDAVRAALASVHDPEIPTVSIVDLGLVHDVRVGSATPGPITRQLSDAYCRLVDFDFVGQYLKRLK